MCSQVEKGTKGLEYRPLLCSDLGLCTKAYEEDSVLWLHGDLIAQSSHVSIGHQLINLFNYKPPASKLGVQPHEPDFIPETPQYPWWGAGPRHWDKKGGFLFSCRVCGFPSCKRKSDVWRQTLDLNPLWHTLAGWPWAQVSCLSHSLG